MYEATDHPETKAVPWPKEEVAQRAKPTDQRRWCAFRVTRYRDSMYAATRDATIPTTKDRTVSTRAMGRRHPADPHEGSRTRLA
ncbi:MAG: hypothetical protein A3K59_01095 [Euryarchaeota archaeon RBG_19FT_COMBO_69_17]|nr:MAG: hypothetical protein A3K59_01095 [Euryarchaeota archaeon RBG_19FT_COMBO_69_17]